MSVSLQPSSQLAFQRPFTQLVKRTLNVSNHNQQPVCFKVKTTAPKQYCVRPNSGRIEPGETVEVQVLLQPMKEDPPAGTKCRDKFLVQSVIISPEREASSLPELWAAIEKEDKSNSETIIHEQKIRCSYLPAADDVTANNGTIPEEDVQQQNAQQSHAGDTSFASAILPEKERNSTNAGEEFSSSSPSPNAETSQLDSTTAVAADKGSEALAAAGGALAAGAAAVGLTGVAHSIKNQTGSTRDLPEPISANTTSSNSSSALNSVTKPTSGATSADLETQLEKAKAEIVSLKAQLATSQSNSATSGLRQRSTADSKDSIAGTSQAVAHEAAAAGIPLQVVAGLVIGTFVITWLLF